jgi:RNA polymerase sigma-70 factor (ECF subfamily)
VEPAVFEATMRELLPRLSSILRRFRVPPEDAEDLLQEAFLSLYVHWDAVREKGGYLVASVRRLCQRYHHKRHRRLAQAFDEEMLELLAAPVAPPQEQFEARHDARHHLAQLTAKQRRAIYLRTILGMTPVEIASVVGTQVDSTRRLVRAAFGALTEQAAAESSAPRSPARKPRRSRPSAGPGEGDAS